MTISVCLLLVVGAAAQDFKPGAYPPLQIGSQAAQNRIEIFNDLQCPASAASFGQYKAFAQKHPDDILITFRNFPLRQHKNALFAAKAGASYVSPFVGRLDDIASDGMGVVRQIREIFDHYGFKTEILVASVRHPMHIVEAARMGADICTCPAAVIEQSFKHPLTDIGLEKFLKDWEKAQGAKAAR